MSSCIINIDQKVDNDWPLEVYGHDGYARNITLHPGEMLLYEVSQWWETFTTTTTTITTATTCPFLPICLCDFIDNLCIADISLKQSHTILHGRPFPLKGQYYANMFVNFRPLGHDKGISGIPFSPTRKNQQQHDDDKQPPSAQPLREADQMLVGADGVIREGVIDSYSSDESIAEHRVITGSLPAQLSPAVDL